jgi:hypothetical protein
MKRTSFSKSVRTIGLMAILSVIVATTLQQPIQAQSKGNRIPTTEDGTCKPLPQGVFYQEFGGIKFSSKQKAAYRKSMAKVKERFKVINAATKEIDDPTQSVIRIVPIGKTRPEFAAANDMYVDLLRKKVPTAKIIELINEKYGKYVKAGIAKVVAPYTQEVIAAGQQIGLDFEAEMMSVFTPEQQKIYAANLAVQRLIQACVDPTPFAKIMSPLPF